MRVNFAGIHIGLMAAHCNQPTGSFAGRGTARQYFAEGQPLPFVAWRIDVGEVLGGDFKSAHLRHGTGESFVNRRIHMVPSAMSNKHSESYRRHSVGRTRGVTGWSRSAAAFLSRYALETWTRRFRSKWNICGVADRVDQQDRPSGSFFRRRGSF